MVMDGCLLVTDPFAGSCVTGEVCEKLQRKWTCIDLVEDYLRGGLARFHQQAASSSNGRNKDEVFYKIPHPGIMWDEFEKEELPKDGGKSRPKPTMKKRSQPEQPTLFSLAKP
jgi:site-specific DNA-methyltransferase (cytosine-N4-specific)